MAEFLLQVFVPFVGFSKNLSSWRLAMGQNNNITEIKHVQLEYDIFFLLEYQNKESTQKTIERYRTYTKDNIGNKSVQQDIEQVKADAEGLAKKLEALEAYKRKLLGEKLEECSIEELHSLEVKLERSLISIRGRKTRLMEEQVAKLREKEIKLRKDNEDLREKCKNQPAATVAPAPLTEAANPDLNNNDDDDDMDVETELFIGLPGRGRSSGAAADAQAEPHS
uniref:K-box domain-containing protein n=1 Tax=Oryza brachyantha TaxID=4533 RepID=J3LJE8_ORYBR